MFRKRRQAFIMPMPSYFLGTTTFLTSKSTDELFVSDNLFPLKCLGRYTDRFPLYIHLTVLDLILEF